MEAYKFTLEQYVIINNITGYIEYIGEEVIGLITFEKEIIYINAQDIKEVKFLEENQQIQDCTLEYEGFLYTYSTPLYIIAKST